MIIKQISHITHHPPQRKASIALSDVGVDQKSQRRVLRADLEDKLIKRLNRRSHIGWVEWKLQTWQSLHHPLHFTWRPLRFEFSRIENITKVARP